MIDGRHAALAGAGAAAAGAALWWWQTPLGALLWTLALVVASVGYGGALARWLGERPTIGAAAATGLACLIVISTLLAHSIGLSPAIELGLVGLGIAACALGRRAEGASATPRGALVFAALAGALLVGSQLTGASPWLTDGVNHAMEIKRLWDTHALGALPGQAGGLIVAESYVALAGGAGIAGAFDPGLCAALVVLLLASEVASRRDGFAIAAFLVLAIPVALNPEPTVAPIARWSGTLFHLACWFALDRAVAERRFTGWQVPSALALIALHWEFAVIALPYLAGGVLVARQQPSRRAAAAVSAGWLIALIALGGAGPAAMIRAIAVTAAAAIASALIVPVISSHPRRSPLGVLVFVAVAASLGTALALVPSAARSAAQPWLLWFTVGAGVLALSDGQLVARDARPRIRLPVTAVAFTSFAAFVVLAPNFVDLRRARIRDRLVDATTELAYTAVTGYDTRRADAAADLQRAVPPGAPLGVWSTAAGALDYARNPISDLSQGGRLTAPMSRAALRGARYVVIEDTTSAVAAPAVRIRDPWAPGRVSATSDVADLLVPLGTIGAMKLYRVDHGRAPPAAR